MVKRKDSEFELLSFGVKFGSNKKRKVSKAANFSAVSNFIAGDGATKQRENTAPQDSDGEDIANKSTNNIEEDDIDETDSKIADDLTILSSLKDVASAEQLTSAVKQKLKKKKKNTAKLKRLQREEMIQSVRKRNRIFVWGEDVADPCSSFADLALPSQLMENLSRNGFVQPTPVQMQAIPIMLANRELMASAPTGSGKTLAFALPIIATAVGRNRDTGLHALVLQPTRELAAQTYKELLKLVAGFDLTVTSLLDDTVEEERIKQSDILVSTPNRLIYTMELPAAKWLRKRLRRLKWLIVDECDKLFESGDRGFRQQLASIYKATNGTGEVRRALFSATFSHELEDWCRANLDNMLLVCVGPRNGAVESVHQRLVFAGSEHGKVVALRTLLSTSSAAAVATPCLLFVQSKQRAEELHRRLVVDEEIANVDVMHSGRSQQQRTAATDAFASGSVRFLICTELLGRGIDFKAVSTVINFDLPTSVVAYVHRIGRTGRAGMSGQAITFFTESDLSSVRPIASVIKQAGGDVPDYTLKLKNPTRKTKRKMQVTEQKRPNIYRMKDVTRGRNKKK